MKRCGKKSQKRNKTKEFGRTRAIDGQNDKKTLVWTQSVSAFLNVARSPETETQKPVSEKPNQPLGREKTAKSTAKLHGILALGFQSSTPF